MIPASASLVTQVYWLTKASCYASSIPMISVWITKPLDRWTSGNLSPQKHEMVPCWY
jgi:hypothetical protein